MTSSDSYLEDGRARAKINLTLHVGRVLAEGKYKGYHPIDSFVAFAGVADRVKFCKNVPSFSLDIQGSQSAGLSCDSDNLILRAAQSFFGKIGQPASGGFSLEKNLPIASGMGGGSADCAAALRLLLREYETLSTELRHSDIIAMAEALGADVPVCYYSQTCYMRGIGEQIEPAKNLGRIPALLVNPGFGVSTAEIFKAYDARERPETPNMSSRAGSLLERAIGGRNDLQDVAIAIRPEIGALIDKLSNMQGCLVSRMSGSGATCFAVFESFEHAVEARNIILKETPNYWCVPTLLGDVK